MNSKLRYWAIVPAAGSGQRMGAEKPKQYLSLLGRTVLEHTLERLAGHPAIQGIVVALADNDPHWGDLKFRFQTPLMTTAGGKERCHSVFNALTLLSSKADAQDWVLVHDAARPCLREADLNNLIDTVTTQNQGGLLAVPVRDTMKQADDEQRVDTTVDRSGLWHAQTPQMFRLQELQDALQQTIDAHALVTDESSAMEWAGYHPLLVKGHADNIKITQPEDLMLAEFYLKQQIKQP